MGGYNFLFFYHPSGGIYNTLEDTHQSLGLRYHANAKTTHMTFNMHARDSCRFFNHMLNMAERRFLQSIMSCCSLMPAALCSYSRGSLTIREDAVTCLCLDSDISERVCDGMNFNCVAEVELSC